MDIEYCEKWWFSKKKPITLLDAKSAKRRHDSRKSYVALLDGSIHPKYIVDLPGQWVSVIFLDHLFRQYLRYDFQEKRPGRIFLKTAMYWEYRIESETEISSKIFSFQEDGQVFMEYWEQQTNDIRELSATADVTFNWEEYPEFGHYESLCREERGDIIRP